MQVRVPVSAGIKLVVSILAFFVAGCGASGLSAIKEAYITRAADDSIVFGRVTAKSNVLSFQTGVFMQISPPPSNNNVWAYDSDGHFCAVLSPGTYSVLDIHSFYGFLGSLGYLYNCNRVSTSCTFVVPPQKTIYIGHLKAEYEVNLISAVQTSSNVTVVDEYDADSAEFHKACPFVSQPLEKSLCQQQ